MSSLWHSTRASLDDSLKAIADSVEKLKAAKSVEVGEIVEQLKTAAESARNLRALIATEAPQAAWQSRSELETVLQDIERKVEARAIEEKRARLNGLAGELERGTIVHRRTVRVTQLNQLRQEAIQELRAEAGVKGAPQTLPGPEAFEWLDWACGLQEPEDTEHLQTLRSRFPHLDEFVANLEPSMWTLKKEVLV